MHNNSLFRQTRLILIAMLSLVVISGCSIHINDDDAPGSGNHRQLEKHNRALIADLSIGTDINTVRQQLGIADFDDRLADGHRILYYRTQHQHNDGDTTRDECTPLIFVDQKLVAWGQLALDKL